MSEKAFITKITNFTNGTGHWGFTVEALLGELGQTVTATAETDLPWTRELWMLLIKTAVIGEAINNTNTQTAVDQVIFPDFTIVGVADEAVPSVVVATNESPARAIGGAAWRPSLYAPTEVNYSVRITCTKGLLDGDQHAIVRLLSDANNPPTTPRAQVEHSLEGLINLAATSKGGGQLHYTVPAGDFVALDIQVLAGNPSAVITLANEQRR